MVQENVFEDLFAPEGPFTSFLNISGNLTSSPFELRSGNTGSTKKTWSRVETRTAEFNNTDSSN